jgi:hypothetical protein
MQVGQVVKVSPISSKPDPTLSFAPRRINLLSTDPEVANLEAIWRRFQDSIIREKWREGGVNLVIAAFWSWLGYTAYESEAEHSEIFLVQAILCWVVVVPGFRGTWLGITTRFILITTGFGLLFRTCGLNDGTMTDTASTLLRLALCIFILYEVRAAYKELRLRFPSLWQVTVKGKPYLLISDARSFLWFVSNDVPAAISSSIDGSAEICKSVSTKDLKFLKAFCLRCAGVVPQKEVGRFFKECCPQTGILLIWGGDEGATSR